MQYLPKNEQPFSAGKQSFEQNITPKVAYSARKITATLQQNSEWLVLLRRISALVILTALLVRRVTKDKQANGSLHVFTERSYYRVNVVLLFLSSNGEWNY
jgi:hypothetical protein